MVARSQHDHTRLPYRPVATLAGIEVEQFKTDENPRLMIRNELGIKSEDFSVGIEMRRVTSNIGIVTFPISKSGTAPLSNLANLISKLAERVFVVSGCFVEDLNLGANVQMIVVDHKASAWVFTRAHALSYLHTQLKIFSHVIAISRYVDLFVFFIGGQDLLFSIFALKLLKRNVILMPADFKTRVYFAKKDFLSRTMSLCAGASFSLADKLILYSRTLMREANLAKYDRKIIIAHEHFVDFTKFATKKMINERLNMVGYIGRLSEEKGILNLIDAMPAILKKRTDVCFAICGEGSLTNEVEKRVKANGLEATTRLMKWVTHEDVPRYLNELKLLVLPSFTEGLPNILLEAMACGTPILAMPVGAVPSIIKDGETGFLLTSNDPGHIASKTVELLNEPQLLEKVSKNAYDWVRENFSEEKTIEAWQRILDLSNIS